MDVNSHVKDLEKSLADTCSTLIKGIVMSEREKLEKQIQAQQLEFTKQMNAEIIDLNVGGTLYSTTLDTLRKQPDSLLGKMFTGRYPIKKDRNGAYFIDRNGQYFSYVLDQLRDGDVAFPTDTFARQKVVRELEFFSLVPERKPAMWTLDRNQVMPNTVSLSHDNLTLKSTSSYGASVGTVNLRDTYSEWYCTMVDLVNSYWVAIGVCDLKEVNVKSFAYSTTYGISSEGDLYRMTGITARGAQLKQGDKVKCVFDGQTGTFEMSWRDHTVKCDNLQGKDLHPFVYVWQPSNTVEIEFAQKLLDVFVLDQLLL